MDVFFSVMGNLSSSANPDKDTQVAGITASDADSGTGTLEDEECDEAILQQFAP